jgi:hypothetical protein
VRQNVVGRDPSNEQRERTSNILQKLKSRYTNENGSGGDGTDEAPLSPGLNPQLGINQRFSNKKSTESKYKVNNSVVDPSRNDVILNKGSTEQSGPPKNYIDSTMLDDYKQAIDDELVDHYSRHSGQKSSVEQVEPFLGSADTENSIRMFDKGLEKPKKSKSKTAKVNKPKVLSKVIIDESQDSDIRSSLKSQKSTNRTKPSLAKLTSSKKARPYTGIKTNAPTTTRANKSPLKSPLKSSLKSMNTTTTT